MNPTSESGVCHSLPPCVARCDWSRLSLSAIVFRLGWMIALPIPIMLIGCDRSSERPRSISGPTMGTTYTVKVSRAPADFELPEFQQVLEDHLARINDLMSTYQDDSEISRFNRHEGTDWFEVSEETAHVVDQALKVSQETAGAFDPTVGPWVKLWNFGPNPRSNSIPSADQLSRQAASVGAQLVDVRLTPPSLRRHVPGVELDLSGIAKGYAVDRLSDLLEQHGVQGFMIEIGGEIRTYGKRADGKTWMIGIEAPSESRLRPIAVVPLSQAGLATSGDYRNYYIHDGRRVSHLIDPTTGNPVDHALASVSVVEPLCLRADALATALMVMGPRRGMDYALRHELSAMFVVRTELGFDTQMTPNFERLLADQPTP